MATSCKDMELRILYHPLGEMSRIMVSSDGSSLVVDSSDVSVNTLSDIASICGVDVVEVCLFLVFQNIFNMRDVLRAEPQK